MRNLKKLLSLAMVVALVFSLSAAAFAAPLSDYPDYAKIQEECKKNEEMETALQVLVELGCIGAPNADGSLNALAAEKALTRAEFYTMVARAVDGNNMANTGALYKMHAASDSLASKFTDVVKGAWYYPYLSWASSKGYMAGNGNGKCGPNDNITFTQAMQILLRIVGFDNDLSKVVWGPDYELTIFAFADMAGINFIQGYVPSNFSAITRGELALFLYRAMGVGSIAYGPAPQYTMYPDNGATLLASVHKATVKEITATVKTTALETALTATPHALGQVTLADSAATDKVKDFKIKVEGTIVDQGMLLGLTYKVNALVKGDTVLSIISTAAQFTRVESVMTAADKVLKSGTTSYAGTLALTSSYKDFTASSTLTAGTEVTAFIGANEAVLAAYATTYGFYEVGTISAAAAGAPNGSVNPTKLSTAGVTQNKPIIYNQDGAIKGDTIIAAPYKTAGWLLYDKVAPIKVKPTAIKVDGTDVLSIVSNAVTFETNEMTTFIVSTTAAAVNTFAMFEESYIYLWNDTIVYSKSTETVESAKKTGVYGIVTNFTEVDDIFSGYSATVTIVEVIDGKPVAATYPVAKIGTTLIASASTAGGNWANVAVLPLLVRYNIDANGNAEIPVYNSGTDVGATATYANHALATNTGKLSPSTIIFIKGTNGLTVVTGRSIVNTGDTTLSDISAILTTADAGKDVNGAATVGAMFVTANNTIAKATVPKTLTNNSGVITSAGMLTSDPESNEEATAVYFEFTNGTGTYKVYSTDATDIANVKNFGTGLFVTMTGTDYNSRAGYYHTDSTVGPKYADKAGGVSALDYVAALAATPANTTKWFHTVGSALTNPSQKVFYISANGTVRTALSDADKLVTSGHSVFIGKQGSDNDVVYIIHNSMVHGATVASGAAAPTSIDAAGAALTDFEVVITLTGAKFTGVVAANDYGTAGSANLGTATGLTITHAATAANDTKLTLKVSGTPAADGTITITIPSADLTATSAFYTLPTNIVVTITVKK